MYFPYIMKISQFPGEIEESTENLEKDGNTKGQLLVLTTSDFSHCLLNDGERSYFAIFGLLVSKMIIIMMIVTHK